MAKDTPLGKGIIKIEADISALERSLSEARAKVQNAAGAPPRVAVGTMIPTDFGAGSSRAGGTSGAGGPPSIGTPRTISAAGGGGGGGDEIENAKAQKTAIDEVASSTENLAEKTQTVRDAIKEQLAPLRNVLGTIKLITGAVTGILGVWTLLVTPVKMVMEYFEGQAKALGDVRRAAYEAAGEIYTMTTKSMLAEKKPSLDVAERRRLTDEYERRKKFIEETYDLQWNAANKLDGEKGDLEKARIDKEKQDALDKLNAIHEKDRAELATTQMRRQIAAEENQRHQESLDRSRYEKQRKERTDAIDEENRQTTDRLKAELEGPRALIALRHEEQIKELRKRKNQEIRSENLEIYEQQIALVEQLKTKELQEFDDAQREKQEREKTRLEEAADLQRRLQENVIKEVAQKTAELQQQVNNMFSADQLEVSMNRVASLIQVLIDKTGR